LKALNVKIPEKKNFEKKSNNLFLQGLKKSEKSQIFSFCSKLKEKAIFKEEK